MKRFIIIIYLIIANLLFPDNIYNPFYYDRMTVEPVKWSVEGGVYTESVELSLSSEYGKIFYIINSDLRNREPAEYIKKIILKGEEGSIIDYEVVVILEKDDGNIEAYSRIYRIDKTGLYKKSSPEDLKNVYETKEYINDNLILTYQFPTDEYNITITEKEFVFPLETQKNDSYKKKIELTAKKDKLKHYFVNLTYNKENQKYTEIKSYIIDKEGTKPPSFGSLFWGQVYRQSYKIKIMPDKNTDVIYYWMKEWNDKDLIFGPPPREKIDKWVKYTEPIELKTQYGMDGITGIAAFSVGQNGEPSAISGPYYFKINGIDKTFEQVFYNELNQNGEKILFINNNKYEGEDLFYYGNTLISFNNFSYDDKFYFIYNCGNNYGKSDLIPCEGTYTFINNSNIPAKVELFLSNGDKIAGFDIISGVFNIPVLKKYTGNYLEVASDEKIEFYMPKNDVRFEVTSDLNKKLKVANTSQIFTGSIKFSVDEGEEEIFRIKFASFNENNEIIEEAEELVFKVDRRYPVKEVEAEGVDFKMFHNEPQILKLAGGDDNVKIYYKLALDDEWLPYEKPVSFYPPLYGKYSIKIYTKQVYESGVERENEKPFEIFFDTRGIFVDQSKDYSGNGTEQYPLKSLERALKIAKLKNIKIIYLLSEKNKISFPMLIDTDIIIQPYKLNIRPKIYLTTKSVWKKNHIWFDVLKDGYLEIRNIDFDINSGNVFATVNESKLKLYNIIFSYTGGGGFSFLESFQGKIGINNLNMTVIGEPDDFSFLNSYSGYNILKNIKVNAKLNNVLFFKIENAKLFDINNIETSFDVSGNMIFTDIKNSNIIIKNLIYNQKGNFINTNLFNLYRSNLFIDESDFIIKGNSPFEIKLAEQNRSEIKINRSLFLIDKATSVLGFNSYNSGIDFERSMIDVKNVLDYIYDFRCENSILKISSSIIRNYGCENAITFSLKESTIEGVNNSIFNKDIKSRGFNYWITEQAKVVSVNNLYYFDEKNENSAFIFFNNTDYNNLKPVWYSNIISTNVVLLDNLEGKESQQISKDFGEKNIFFTFTNEFKIDADDFFMPYFDSPLLQGGVSENNSPIAVPDVDFLGNNRMIPGIGIDIGAIQKSGNF